MNDSAINAYDEVPYESVAATHSHPAHLATLATLFGMNPRVVDRCRVLELGCAEGGNLIPLACSLAQSQFLGIDYSQRQIEAGQQTIKRLGLKNIELRHADIREYRSERASFDYVLAHGVYSWVPSDVRPRLLEVCGESLAPNGVAFVSHNTYPGCHMRKMVREMMLFHIRNCSDARQQVTEARELLTFLIDSVPDEHTAYRAALNWELAHIKPFDDHQMRHDLLEAEYDAITFSEFTERAGQHRLQYLADAKFATMLPRNFGSETFEKLKSFSRNVIDVEQYMDFLRNRTYRETLLCHNNIRIERNIAPEKISGLYVASSLKPVSEQPEIESSREELFQNGAGGELRTSRPLAKAAVMRLIDVWPRNMVFSELLDHARSRVQVEASQTAPPHEASHSDLDRDALSETLLHCFSNGLVELSVCPSTFTLAVEKRPLAGSLVRLQAETGQVVTNQRHEMIKVDSLQRLLLQKLDGQRDNDQLLEMLVDFAAQGTLTLERNGQPITDRLELRDQLADRLNAGLRGLANAALLVN